MDLYYILVGATFLLSMVVSNRLKATYRKWGSIRNTAGVTGARTAVEILTANQVRDVRIDAAPGQLTDHYDPASKVIRLSEPVYGVPSVAAISIAAHEVGHALQHAKGYWPLTLRTKLVPVASLAQRFGIPAALLGLMNGSMILIQIGVLGYAAAFVFQVVTLPVEFNASHRALENIGTLGLVNEEEKKGARSVLRAAAMTYVSAVASSAGFVLYLALLAGRWLFPKPAG